jgi:hypothetical protein
MEETSVGGQLAQPVILVETRVQIPSPPPFKTPLSRNGFFVFSSGGILDMEGNE